MLKRFRHVSSLRRLVDEVQDPPLLVLEHFDSNMLIESGVEKLQSSDVKHVAKVVLTALMALHEEGIVCSYGCVRTMATTHRHTLSDSCGLRHQT